MAAFLAAIPSSVFAYDSPEALPEGPGREESFYTCVACHSFQVVVRQGMSRAMWDDTLNLMVERHGMPELDGDQRALILDYLSKNFPKTTSTSGQGGWKNPFTQ
jgi:hypothetical protein